MKKVMLLAAMLAMVLAAAAPAFAQTQEQFLSCADVLDVGGDITQYDGTLNVNQICTQAGEDAFVNVATGEIATATQVAGNEVISLQQARDVIVSGGGGGGAVVVPGATTTVLPDTGGVSLFTLGAGALLVAGGLLARRIVR